MSDVTIEEGNPVELTVEEGDPVILTLSLGPSVLDGDKGDVEVSSNGGSWTVEGLQGRAVSATAPTNGYALVWNSTTSEWEPQAQSGGGGISDGDKGDITVSGSGATWTIDNDAVTFAKMQNVEEACLLGRESGAGTGDVKVVKLDSQFVWTTIGGKPALTISTPKDATKVDTSTQVNAGTGLTGGGDLSANRTISVATNGITTSLIADANVTFAKMQAVSANVLLGNDATGTTVEEIICTAAGRAILDDADASAQRTTLGLGTVATESTVPISKGGTGQTTAVAAFDALAPTTTKGDLIAHDGSDNVRLAVGGTNGHVLTVDSTTSTGLKWAAGGGAGTKTYARFGPLDAQPPATNFATLDTRNSIAVLEFDGGSTDESTVFVSIMPEAAVLTSGLEVRIHWMADTATSENVRWGVQFERCNTDLDSDSFDTAAEANSAANGTSGIPSVASITNTNIDGITAGDLFRLKIYRKASDTTNDKMSGDAQLIAVEVRGV